LSQCQPFQALRFRELPATLLEAQAVARIWRQAVDAPTSAASNMLLSGREATETAFKQQGPGRRIIHLATHGFVLDTECDNAISGLRGVGGLTPARSPGVSRRSPVDNPLLFSGLAMAGANRRLSVRDENDDGILTAEEVASVNLEGVEWAVLSACDTGLGEIRGGEGVFGLRRAFQVAGVRTVVISLWGVDDRSTQIWMEILYRVRLVNHLDTAESVREASLRFIRERRAKGLSTHPFYWAGFVAAGDWK
jgi:CHAT domain-containing protein